MIFDTSKIISAIILIVFMYTFYDLIHENTLTSESSWRKYWMKTMFLLINKNINH